MKEEKNCLQCGKLLEGLYQIRFCSGACAGVWNGPNQIKDRGTCILCSKQLKSGQNKFCSRSCSVSVNNIGRARNPLGKSQNNPCPIYKLIDKTLKKCLNCNNLCNDYRRKYCRQECKIEYTYNKFIEDWKNGNIDGCLKNSGKASSTIHKYIWNKYDSKCARCGWAEIHPTTGHPPLEVEHIDGDWTNCKEDNLILLCPNCHALTLTYRALNKTRKSGRPKGQRKVI